MNLELVLKTGTLVEIEYTNRENVTQKLNTLIDYPYKDDVFTIYAPMVKGAVYPMQENDQLTVYFMVDNAEKTDKEIFKIKTRIDKRGYTNGIAVYKIYRTGEPEKVQRRGAFRLPIMKDYTILVGEEHRNVNITTTNISGTGLKSICSEKIEAKSTIILRLNTEPEIIEIPCTVVMCNALPDSISKYDLRLQFIIEKDVTSQKINAFLFKKQAEVIQKNIGPEGYSDLYYKVNEAEHYDPEKESANQQSTIYVFIAVFLSVVALSAYYFAVPKDPAIVFRTLIKLNIAYNSWNYTYLLLGILVSAVNILVCILGIYTKRKYRLPGQMPIHVPLTALLIINFIVLLFGITNYTA